MRAGKTVFLFVAVLLLGGYIWFVERNVLSPAEQKAVDRQAFDLPMDRVDRIGIRTASLNVEMVAKDLQWVLTEPAGARASEPVVRQLLARFRTLSRGEFITPADMRTRGLTLADFGLEVPQLVLTLGMNDERRVYAVGSPNPLGNALYVKEESSQNIMLVSSDLLEVLPDTDLSYRDPSLFPVGPAEVQELTLVSGGRTVRLERDGPNWWIRDPVRGKGDVEQVDLLLTKFEMSRIEDVINRPTAEELESFAGREENEIIRILPQAQTVPLEVVLGGTVPGEPERCYARITGQDGLVKVSVGLRQLATSSAEGLRDRTVLSLSPEQIDRIQITDEGQKIVLRKRGIHWQVEEPYNLPASDARVQNLIARWQDAIVERFLPVEGTLENLTSVGGILFEDTAGAQRMSFTLFDESPRPGRAVLRNEGSEELLQVVPDVVKFLPRDPFTFLSRKVVNFKPEDVVRVQVESEDTSYAITRQEGDIEWVSRELEEEVLITEVRELLANVSSLFADSVVTLGSDLENDVTARLSIGLGGETPSNLTLVVSGSKAWVQGGDVAYVFAESRLESLFTPVTRPLLPDDGVEDGETVTP